MLAPLLLIVAVILLASSSPVPSGTYFAPSAPPQVILTAGDTPDEDPDAVHLAEASQEVVAMVAGGLAGRGIQVSAGEPALFTVAVRPTETVPTGETVRESVTLTVSFNHSPTPHASGSETRFGGDGDDAWRMAWRVQRHLVSGLRDLLGYDSYDRGAVEQSSPVWPPNRSPDSGLEEPWVAAYPFFATNPLERNILLSSWGREVTAAALTNAILEYLDPSVVTPERSSHEGWRTAPQWQPLAPRVVTRAATSPMVALTFDGGSSSLPTPPILTALREAQVRATMFMTADFVQRNPDLVVQMAKDGHEFGNHSATHPDMTRLSDAQIVAQLDRLERAVLDLTGRSTRPWFRPPFGAYDQRVVNTVAGQGYRTVLWTADSGDWRPELTPAAVEGRLLSQASPGAILIQHLGSPQSSQVTARVLAKLKARGVEMGTLSEVVGPLD